MGTTNLPIEPEMAPALGGTPTRNGEAGYIEVGIPIILVAIILVAQWSHLAVWLRVPLVAVAVALGVLGLRIATGARWHL